MTLMPHNTTIEKMQSQKYTWPNCSLFLMCVEDFFVYILHLRFDDTERGF